MENIKFLKKENNKEVKEVHADTDKYDVILFKNKKLEDLGPGAIDTNFHYIFLENDEEIENAALKLIEELNLDYRKELNFIPFLKGNEISLIINSTEYKAIDIYKKLYESNYNNYSQLQLAINFSKILKEIKEKNK